MFKFLSRRDQTLKYLSEDMQSCLDNEIRAKKKCREIPDLLRSLPKYIAAIRELESAVNS
jgi:hypothetical protein